MGDKNPIRSLGDYSKPSHKGYRNTIELPIGNNVVPLRSDTIRLVQNGCSFHELRSEDPNQHLKDFLKLVDSLDLDNANRERTRLRSITTWEDLTTRFLAQFFLPGRTAKLHNDILTFQQHHEESVSKAWTRFKDLLQNSLIMASTFGSKSKFFMTMLILSQDEPLTNRPVNEMTNKIDIALKAITDRIAGALPTDMVKNSKLSTSLVLSPRSYLNMDPQYSNHIHGSIKAVTIHPDQQSDSYDDKAKENEEEEKDNPENIHSNSSTPPDPSVSFITEKVLKLNSFFESLGLVPQLSITELVCTKGDDGDVIFDEKKLESRKAHLLKDKQIPSVGVLDEVFSTWMAFGGNTRDLGSFGEETDEITDLHQILEEILLTKRGDGVASIKRRRRDVFSDGIWKLKTASRSGQLKEDLESST
ncbi:zinc finger, CCHC-type containing protein [Tanacetum coccineum]